MDQKLNIEPDTLYIIEEKVGSSFEYIGIGGNFLNRTSMSQSLISTIDKWDLLTCKGFYKATDTVHKIKCSL